MINNLLRDPYPPMPIVLASASPRRQELLKNAGINFVVRPANIEEIQRVGEDPVAFAERLARAKARAVRDSACGSVILGAYPMSLFGYHFFVKPSDTSTPP